MNYTTTARWCSQEEKLKRDWEKCTKGRNTRRDLKIEKVY